MPSKGQSVTEEAKAKFKESRTKTWAAKFLWELIDPQLYDVELDLSSRNSGHDKITIRQFKNMVLSGKNADDIIQTGISKHLVAFLGSYCSGTIKITKNEFNAMYSSGKSLDEMAKILLLPRNTIGYLRQLFGIKAKGAKFINRKKTEIPITARQREIICGSLFGDACRMSSSSVKFVHGGEQKEYLLWKFSEMRSISTGPALRGTPYKDERTGFEGISWRFYTSANTDVEEIISKFYPDEKKVVSMDMLNEVGPLGLAVWYQDDGQFDFRHRSFEKESQLTPVYKLCTDSFSVLECEMIVGWLRDKFGLGAELVPSSNGKGWRVKISNESSDAFKKLIEPHVIPSMRYKLDYKDYLLDKGAKADSPAIAWTEAKKCPLGLDFVSLDMEKQGEWIRKILAYVRTNGFSHLLPKPSENEEEAKRIFSHNSSTLTHDDCVGFSPVGSMYVLSFFENFWDAKAKAMLSPRQIFNDDSYLSEIIRELIHEGKFPRRSALLRKLRRYRGNKSVSVFMPCMAKAIYEKFCLENSKVVDFCAGYGGRLIGALASKKVKTYVGLEPNFKSYVALNKLRDNFSEINQVKKDASIQNQDSGGLGQFADGAFDVCFTSPPYFDAEEYSEEPSQSMLQYREYDTWFNSFLIASVTEAMRVSKKVLINIANTGSYKIADDLRNWAIKNGVLVEESMLRYPSRSKKYRLEPLFVMSKRSGSPVAE